MTRPLVLPSKKNLLGFARALAKAENPLQLALLEESYRRHLAGDVDTLEVLDLLRIWVGAALASSAGSKCFSCQGSRFEAAQDNDGGYYMGCACCTIVIPPELEELLNAKRADRPGGDRGAAFAPVRPVRRKLSRPRREQVRESDQSGSAPSLLPPRK